jgi:hypothetical protein
MRISAAAGELLADSPRQRIECPERIPVARHQPAGTVFDIRDGRKPSSLYKKTPMTVNHRKAQ